MTKNNEYNKDRAVTAHSDLLDIDIYETSRLILRRPNLDDFDAIKDYLYRNKEFLAPWEPLRTNLYYDEDAIYERLEKQVANKDNPGELGLYVFLKDSYRIIGSVTLSSIIKGPFQSCYIGYKLDVSEVNKGYMTEAVQQVIDIAFNNLGLHRIEANIMPRNNSSIKVVQKLGFEYEGLSKEYLKINGVWEDHAHYVILNKKV